MNAFIQLDGNILIAIQRVLIRDWLTPIMVLITHLGDYGLICIASALVLVCCAKYRRAGIMTLTAMAIEFIINNLILKNAFHRTRPYETLPQVQLLIGEQSDWSFPSGHAAVVFCAALMIYLTLPKRYGVPALVIALLIAISRLYVGVHYPSDVIFGAVSGGLIAYSVYRGFTRRERRTKGAPEPDIKAQ